MPAKKLEKRAMLSKELVANVMTMRSELLRHLLDDKRDIDSECGYPSVITPEVLHKLYEREGIATRVVRCLPEESWSVDPDVYETEDPSETAFEKAWGDLLRRHNLLHHLQRADELSGIGHFGILLLGLDDGKELSEAVEGLDEKGEKTGDASHDLLYLRTFDESVVVVKSRETNVGNPRYGLPTLYAVNFQDVSVTGLGAGDSITKDIHWTRVIHIADGRTMSEVYGTPRLEAVYNRIYDLRKILSGSGEMFWRGALPGYAFEVNPDLADQNVEIDKDSIRTEFENYSNGLQRYLALTGVTAKSLSPQVADPTGHVKNQLEAIAIALSIPFRILFGSEQAQLASSQDAMNWAKRIRKRQTKYIEPMILRPFIDRLIAFGVLPEVEEYFVDWPDLVSLSDQDKAQVGVTRTDALAKYVGGGVDQLVPPESYMSQFLGMTQGEIDSIVGEVEEYQREPGAGLGEAAVGPDGQSITVGRPEDAGSTAGLSTPLNGAQVQAATQIVKDVTSGLLPRASGIGQLMVFFALTAEQAEQVMGDAGTTTPVKSNPGAPVPTGATGG